MCRVSEVRTNAQLRFQVDSTMENFFMILTLSSLTGPQVLFVTHPQPWENELACVRALPKMERAVERLIGYDPAALDLFGATAGGAPQRGYFVSASACRYAEPNP